MKDICQKYVNKIGKILNDLSFLLRKPLNFQLSFYEQATSLNKKRNEMKVLVYKK